MSSLPKLRRLTVMGGGSFGTALADLGAHRGQAVTLWMRDSKQAEVLAQTHKNPRYLSDLSIHSSVSATADLAVALDKPDWLLVTIPCQGLRSFLSGISVQLPRIPIVLACKGIERKTLMTPYEIALDVLGDDWEARVLAMSGPSFAREIMSQQPTAVSLACRDEPLAQAVADVLFCDTFRAYSSTDLAGVELGGALKNVIAIAAGVLTGMGLGESARATLITRGLAEITRLAVTKGANPLTLAGLSGLGDLLLTCTGSLSRNRAIGVALGKGLSLTEALHEVSEVAEGVETTASAYALAKRLNVDAPVISAVYQFLYEGLPLQDGLMQLVRRQPGSEMEHRGES